MKNYLQWSLIGFIVFVFIQSLFFKFSGSEETVIIFSTIGAWMHSMGLPDSVGNTFATQGGYIVGTVELIAALLIIYPWSRFFGALLSLSVMTGAIFFHLVTPLGVNRIIDEAGNTDGGLLFFMACGVWLASAIVLYINYPDEHGQLN
jgi:hypothetical protein